MKPRLTEEEAEGMYREMLNECDINLLLPQFDNADLMKQNDPIAYDCGLTDYIDSLSDEFEVEGQE